MTLSPALFLALLRSMGMSGGQQDSSRSGAVSAPLWACVSYSLLVLVGLDGLHKNIQFINNKKHTVSSVMATVSQEPSGVEYSIEITQRMKPIVFLRS